MASRQEDDCPVNVLFIVDGQEESKRLILGESAPASQDEMRLSCRWGPQQHSSRGARSPQ